MKIENIMEKMNNNMIHINLHEYLEGFNSEMKERSRPIIERLLDELNISEKGDTCITGSQDDWVSFVLMIFERYY